MSTYNINNYIDGMIIFSDGSYVDLNEESSFENMQEINVTNDDIESIDEEIDELMLLIESSDDEEDKEYMKDQIDSLRELRKIIEDEE